MLQAGSDGDDTWLHQRVRNTHDLWHVVCGCPPTAAGEAVAYGLELGRVCAPLLAQRWEEGWGQPLAQWREQLGITAQVERSPFRG